MKERESSEDVDSEPLVDDKWEFPPDIPNMEQKDEDTEPRHEMP